MAVEDNKDSTGAAEADFVLLTGGISLPRDRLCEAGPTADETDGRAF